MRWLFGLAIMPALLCGLMCVGGMVFAAVTTRNSTRQRASSDEPSATDIVDAPRATVQR